MKFILDSAARLMQALSCLLFLQSAATAEQPNIVFIFSDDHAYQAISAYGSELTTTPNIDRIAKEGMRFDRCYVTNSICGPSRACILTGKYSHKNGFYENSQEFDNSQLTFPKLLQQAGYQTAIVGKWHLGHETRPQGFDHWNLIKGQGYYYQSKFMGPLGETQHVGYTTDLVTRYTLQWLNEGRDPEKPFLLMMQHKAPHRPWDPGLDHINDFADHEFPEPETLFDDYENRASAAHDATMRISDHMNTRAADLKAWNQDDQNPPNATGDRNWFYGKMTVGQKAKFKPAIDRKNQKFYEEHLEGKELVRWKYQRYLQDYLACAAGVDDSVGTLLDYLDEQGLAENTIVIYSSDQGFYLGEHGWFDKRFMYEQSLRTPLIVRWPGKVEEGSVNDSIVSNLDFAETFLNIAGAEIPEEMQGRSIVPILEGAEPADWRKSFYYHYYEGRGHNVAEHYGVTNGRLKLIHYYKLDEWELFDLEADPDEMNSVYGKAEYADRQAAMEEELQRLRAELEVTSNDPL